MSGFKSEFLQVLHQRGFIHQATNLQALDEQAALGPITAYIGFDLTADSLHVGSLYPIMLLRILQQTGHRPIVLLGGGTTKVGDPSGKDDLRKLLSPEQIALNKTGLASVFGQFLEFGEGKATFVDNDEWLSQLNYLEFLRDVGRHFSINRMLTFDSVKNRLEREQPLSFIEFNYMILQAYDFVELKKRYGCTLQMGASDQWGNIVNGVELYRRMTEEQDEIFGLTSPLLLNSAGQKMGKSAAGAVWLNREKMSDYDFWQYWRNCEDADVPRFLNLFSELPADEITRLCALQGSEINEAKKALATAITAMVRGQEAANQAAQTAAETFEQGVSSEGLPRIEANLGDRLIDLLVKSGLAESNGKARGHIRAGAVRVNDEKIEDENATLQSTENPAKLSLGKKNHVLLDLP